MLEFQLWRPRWILSNVWCHSPCSDRDSEMMMWIMMNKQVLSIVDYEKHICDSLSDYVGSVFVDTLMNIKHYLP